MVCVSTAADMVRADLFTEPTVTEIHMCFSIPEVGSDTGCSLFVKSVLLANFLSSKRGHSERGQYGQYVVIGGRLGDNYAIHADVFKQALHLIFERVQIYYGASIRNT